MLAFIGLRLAPDLAGNIRQTTLPVHRHAALLVYAHPTDENDCRGRERYRVAVAGCTMMLKRSAQLVKTLDIKIPQIAVATPLVPSDKAADECNARSISKARSQLP